MNRLMEFLADNPVSDISREIKLSGRLSDFTLKVKVLSGKQYNDYQTLSIENLTSNKNRRFNTRRFQELVVVNCLVEPDIKNVEFLKKLNVRTPEEALYKVFLAGEIAQIAEAILQVSGFDEEIEVLEDEVKNSSTRETGTPGFATISSSSSDGNLGISNGLPIESGQ